MAKFILHTLVVAIGSFWIVSCGNRIDQKSIMHEQLQFEFRLNFNEHIYSTNPELANTESEIFVRNVCFEKLFSDNYLLTSRFFDQVTLDTLRSTYHFVLNDKIVFGNGTAFDVNWIKSQLRKSNRNSASNPDILEFFDSVEGRYASANYRIDSLPAGFIFSGGGRFSIKFKKNKEQLRKYLKALNYYVYMAVGEEYYGTGPFFIVDRESDIYCRLARNPNYPNTTSNINQITLRFIKNLETEVDEFINGSLDVLFISPENENQGKANIYARLTDKYPNHMVFPTNQAIIKYLYTNKISNTLLDSLKSVHDFPFLIHYGLGNTTLSNPMDLYKMEKIAVVHDSTMQDSLVSTEIVIIPKWDTTIVERKWVNYYRENHKQRMLEKLMLDIKLFEADTTYLTILEIKPKYFISNIPLNGINDFEELSLKINDVSFKIPKAY